jgi:hypothetical protein
MGNPRRKQGRPSAETVDQGSAPQRREGHEEKEKTAQPSSIGWPVFLRPGPVIKGD